MTPEQILSVRPDFVISYNYKHIISKEIIDLVAGRVINLHISLLPCNRGSHPNLWSLLEDTPKGVTIHVVDEGLDTGDIVVQEEVLIDEEKETLKSSYELLHQTIQRLFKERWKDIRDNRISPVKQKGQGSMHCKRDLKPLEQFLIKKGWDTPVTEFKEKYTLWKSARR